MGPRWHRSPNDTESVVEERNNSCVMVTTYAPRSLEHFPFSDAIETLATSCTRSGNCSAGRSSRAARAKPRCLLASTRCLLSESDILSNMGVLWRLLAPKPVKRIRRAAHPVRVVKRVVTPAPVRKVKRAAWGVVHPIERTEQGTRHRLLPCVTSTPPRTVTRYLQTLSRPLRRVQKLSI